MSSDNETPEFCISYPLPRRPCRPLDGHLTPYGAVVSDGTGKAGTAGLGHDRDDLYDQIERGESLPDDQEILGQVSWLFLIHSCLEQLFPYNPIISEGWIKFPNKALENKSPFKIMLEEGIVGIKKSDASSTSFRSSER